MIGIILSSMAVLLLLALSVYAIARQRAGGWGTFSIFAFLLSGIEVCDQLSLQSSSDPTRYKQAVLCLESLLPATFLFFGLTYFRRNSLRDLSRVWLILLASTVLFPVSVFLFPSSDFFYAPDLQSERVLFLGRAGYWFYIGVMLSCIIVLMNMEAAFSSTSGTDRWKIKFEVIGIMSILAVLIFYFSQGLLYRTINMSFMPVRSGVFIIGALLAGYSKLFRGDGVKAEVSRYILYRSLTLFIVGLYLLILGLVGEGMRYFDISFGKDLTIFLAFASGILIIIVLLSENLRREVKVFINKHFYPRKHDYREEWLNFTKRLSSCVTLSDVQYAILTTYKEVFGLKGVSLYLLDRERACYVPAADLSMPPVASEFEASAGLLSYFRDRNRAFNPLDREYIPHASEALFVHQTGAGLIVPMICNQKVEGIILFGEQLAREKFNYEDYDLMKVLARQAALSTMNVRLSEELIGTREMAAVARISSFVIHDLKNLTHALSLTLDNAEQFMNNPDFQNDMMMTIRNTLSKMKNLIQRLKPIPGKNTLRAELHDIRHLSQETIEEIVRTRPRARIAYQGEPAVSVVDGEEIRKVIMNLIQNALDATGEEEMITVETGGNGSHVYLRVSDTGCGMTEDFLNNHLWKPFRTTKGKGLGIGLYQCKQIVEAHKGSIEVWSEPEKGSVFTVHLPAGRKPGDDAVNFVCSFIAR